jgi:hypothetical protein
LVNFNPELQRTVRGPKKCEYTHLAKETLYNQVEPNRHGKNEKDRSSMAFSDPVPYVIQDLTD